MTRITVVILLALSSSFLHAQDEPLASATRGITGQVIVETEGQTLRGRPDLDLEAPLLVRIAESEELESGHIRWTIDFIGMNEGVFDLRDVLVYADGSNARSLDPILIEVHARLQDDAPTDVFLAAPPARSIPGGYWTALYALGGLWILIPIIVLLFRLLRRAPEVIVEAPPPTLLEKLQPLVHAAAQSELTIEQQGQLELLLYAHWQEQMGLDSDRAEAIARIRLDKHAGRLLRAMESWLHAPDGAAPSTNEIESLLDPYRGATGAGGPR